VLNESSSGELRLLMEKLVHKWNMEKINYLNFLFKHTDLMRPREDLFSFLFGYLLKLAQPQPLLEEGGGLRGMVRDYNRLVTNKLVELLEFYNKKLGKSYKMLTE
jgi:hypothetical protein